jgi:hypothetical protein
MRSKIAGALVASLLVASSAQAQSYVRADCQGLVGVAPNRFDTPEHERWYKRFWTGTCDHLSFCIPGAPNWNDVVGKLLVKGGPSERAGALAQGLPPGPADRPGVVAREVDPQDRHRRPARLQQGAGILGRHVEGRRQDRRGGASEVGALSRHLQRLRQQPSLDAPARARAPSHHDLAAGMGGGQGPDRDCGVARSGRRERPWPAGTRRPGPSRSSAPGSVGRWPRSFRRRQRPWAAPGRRRPGRGRAGSGRPPAGSGHRRCRLSGSTRTEAAIGWLAGAAASSSSSSTWAQSRPAMS